MTRRRRRRLVLIGTPLLLLVVARVFFFELHRVEGVSMWPGINPRGGAEWVLVGRWGEPEAGRLAIFRAPDDSSVVKRVAATGGQTVYFTGGDLKVDSEFVARSLDEILATRVPVIHLDDLALRERRDGPVYEDGLGRRAMVPIRGRIALSDAGGMLKLTDPEGATELRIPAANFMDDHLASSGRLVRGDQVVRDLVVTMGFHEAPIGTALLFEHNVRGQGQARVALWLRVVPDGRVEIVHENPSWSGGFDGGLEGKELRWILVDDRAQLEILSAASGERLLLLPEVRSAALRTPLTAPSESYLSLSLDRGSVVFARLDIDRDIYYTPQPADGQGSRAPLPLGPDQVFVLGDNSPESRDSRIWGPLNRDRFVGRPLWVVWPRERMFEPLSLR